MYSYIYYIEYYKLCCAIMMHVSFFSLGAVIGMWRYWWPLRLQNHGTSAHYFWRYRLYLKSSLLVRTTALWNCQQTPSARELHIWWLLTTSFTFSIQEHNNHFCFYFKILSWTSQIVVKGLQDTLHSLPWSSFMRCVKDITYSQ